MANTSDPSLPVENRASIISYATQNFTIVKDVRDYLFNRKAFNNTPNMTVLPVLALICFIVCVLLKFYKWYKDSVRLKARGDVEFGDESEVNYGIIKAGDKEFCNVEIRSDTTSVYDTVTSFRHMGNGHAIGGCAHNYHDTVTSYKSLLMQRLDGAQYDSVKSYKAFLKQVTQNTDLAVEVKLLENYPVRSKSAEHCVVEEESSGISETMRPVNIGDIKIIVEPKKKPRHRRASGDPIGATRKRSASNPTYQNSRVGAASLPSIHQTLSSDSSNEDECFANLISDRRRFFENRRKMARSCSGGRLAKGSPSQMGECSTHIRPPNARRRHFSADSARRPRKPLGSICHRCELNDLRESISETDPRPEETALYKKLEDSSSENPDSSPTSCSASISSDAIESDSEDDDTQKITQVSITSDDHTVSCEGVFDSCGELASSAEHLLGPRHHSSESVNGICGLPLEVEVTERNGVTYLATPPATSSPSSISKLETNNGIGKERPPVYTQFCTSSAGVCPSNNNYIDNDNHSTSQPDSDISIIQTNTQHHLPSSPSFIHDSNSNNVSSNQPSSSNMEESKSQEVDFSDSATPRRVKRFHVTFISSDLSSQNSE